MKSDRTIEDVGEFGLIATLSEILGQGPARVGIGDDAAVLDLGGPDYVLATADGLVEGVHFHGSVAWRDVGRHALMVNVSDIAAMGGTPRFALVSLSLPGTTSEYAISELYRGLRQAGVSEGVSIVGGNMTRAKETTVIDLTLIGTVPRAELVLRNGARPGDLLVVTGSLGRIAADRQRAIAEDLPWQCLPVSRVTTARALASAGLARAMLDISDGLAGDLNHLCVASGVGAIVDLAVVPVDPLVKEMPLHDVSRCVDLALQGGEDYELLIAIDRREIERAKRVAFPTPLTVIGEVVEKARGVLAIGLDARIRPLTAEGWTHF